MQLISIPYNKVFYERVGFVNDCVVMYRKVAAGDCRSDPGKPDATGEINFDNGFSTNV